MSKPPARQNALLLPMRSLWWVDFFCIQDPSLICCAEGEPFPQMAIQKRSWIQTLCSCTYLTAPEHNSKLLICRHAPDMSYSRCSPGSELFCHTAFPREVTKPGGENSVLWTGRQWGRWVAQVEFHVWVDKIGLCAGLWNSLSSFSSSHRKGSPEDTVLLCANGRWCKYSLCASPWHSVIGHLKPYKGPGMQCVTQTLHEGGEDSWRKVLQHNDKSRNELRGITEGQIMNWKSFRNSSKHRSFVLFSSVPHHRKEAWLSNVSPGETGIECYF